MKRKTFEQSGGKILERNSRPILGEGQRVARSASDNMPKHTQFHYPASYQKVYATYTV